MHCAAGRAYRVQLMSVMTWGALQRPHRLREQKECEVLPEVRMDACGPAPHEGRVIRVSRSTVPTQSNQGQAAEPVYRVLVSLNSQSVLAYGVAEPLRPGMIVDADIMGEKRRIYEWILEPAYSVTGKIGGSARVTQAYR